MRMIRKEESKGKRERKKESKIGKRNRKGRN
jgi:hypothetical protein